MDTIQSLYGALHHTTHVPLSTLDMVLLAVKSIVSACGTFIILVGVITGLYQFINYRLPHRNQTTQVLTMSGIRRDLGQAIVLGLEFIIAADVIETTTTPSYYSLGILALIVAIRTFLSFTLSREIAE